MNDENLNLTATEVSQRLADRTNAEKKESAEMDLALVRLNDLAAAVLLTVAEWDDSTQATKAYFAQHFPNFTDMPRDRVSEDFIPQVLDLIKGQVKSELSVAKSGGALLFPILNSYVEMYKRVSELPPGTMQGKHSAFFDGIGDWIKEQESLSA